MSVIATLSTVLISDTMSGLTIVSTSSTNCLMDDTLDVLELKLDGPSESESCEQNRYNNNGTKETESVCTEQSDSVDYSSMLTFVEPAFHAASDPPYCSQCSTNHNNTYFTLSCQECLKCFETASIPQVFAIIRQWSPSIQSNMIFYIEKVNSCCICVFCFNFIFK